jgi:hypothetical protein
MKLYSRATFSQELLLVVGLTILVAALTTSAGGAAGPPRTSPSGSGEHAFDWEIGTWRSSVQVLADPLSDTPDEWLSFRGTSVVKRLLDHRANVVEFDVSGPAGRIQALNFRLYESGADRWSSTFANLRDGLITPSVFGTFDDGVGTFFGQDQLDGRPIDVRFVITREGPDKARFEQAFSDDGGKTWETNWIAVDRRLD